jgi:hypothetical protein
MDIGNERAAEVAERLAERFRAAAEEGEPRPLTPDEFRDLAKLLSHLASATFDTSVIGFYD